MKTSLKCHCGQCILKRDVMRQAMYTRQTGPTFVYIKYRCSRCKKPGELFIKQEDWHDGLLQDVSRETEAGASNFGTLGPITLDEIRQFHYALADLNEIPNLLPEEQG